HRHHSDWDLVVEVVLARRLRHDWFETDAVDALTLIRGRGAVDFHLVSRPVVRVAKRGFEFFEIRPVDDHRLYAALEVQDRLLLFVLPNSFFLQAGDRRDLRLGLHVATLEVLAWKRIRCTHNEISMMMLVVLSVFMLVLMLCPAPPLRMCGICARRL